MSETPTKNPITPPQKNAVLLLSGGLDSATVLALALKQNYHITALSFDYGQRHRFELAAAQKIAAANKIQNHLTIKINLDQIGGSALTSNQFAVPKNTSPSEDQIPITYVPARNTIFLSCALGLAETINAFDIFIGVNALDYSGYPDCRPEFINAFQNLANLATKAGVQATQSNQPENKFRIQAPLINLTKAQIIQQGTALGVNYQLTHSCYDPQPNTGHACGACDACILRKRGFEEANIPDPTIYINHQS